MSLAATSCLARFGELTEIGLEALTMKYDPYWNVPLNEGLPEPVIELAVQGSGDRGQGSGDGEQLGLGI